jgi:hypothetical protein
MQIFNSAGCARAKSGANNRGITRYFI